MSHDRVYVADRDNARIQIFDLNGRFISLWQGQPIGRPYSVAVSDYDEVFIVDGGRADKPLNRVVRLNVEGTVIESFDAGWPMMKEISAMILLWARTAHFMRWMS